MRLTTIVLRLPNLPIGALHGEGLVLEKTGQRVLAGLFQRGQVDGRLDQRADRT